MATIDKFNRATRLIPGRENLKTRYLQIYEGSLYFKGDSSQMVCTNFIDSEVNVQVDFNTLRTGVSIGGDIRIAKVDEHTIKFTNGDQQFVVACLPVTERPAVNIPEKSLYTEMPEFMIYCRPLINLLDKYAFAGTFQQDEFAGAIVASNKALACVAMESPDGMDMDLVRLQDVIPAAIANDAKIHLTGRKISFLIEGDGHDIYAQTTITPSTINSKMKDLAMSVTRGKLEAADDEAIIRFVVKGGEILKILPTIEKIRTGGYIVMEIEDGKTRIRASDSISSEYEAYIDTSSSGKVVVSTRVIERGILEFLSSAIGKIATENYVITINTDMQRMVIRTEEQIEGIHMFVVMAVAFKVV